MSKKTDDFERCLANAIQNIFKEDIDLSYIPTWFEEMFGLPPYKIESIKSMGGQLGKTDILVCFSEKQPLKISAKMANADYWGNWYSHNRFIKEFGETSFNKIVEDCTKWANEWVINPNANFFIGVSVSFGRRTGNTGRPLGDILNIDDVMAIIQGRFSNTILNANTTYISNMIPQNIDDFFNFLSPINEEVIKDSGILNDMKIIYRPINPMTEGSNRGKCIYTKFKPYKAFKKEQVITTLEELNDIGEFVKVTNNSLNHNRHIKYLKEKYKVVIPIKIKE